MKPDYKKFLPYLVAIVLFAILTLVYFKPLLSGKELKQDDIVRHRGMSKEIVDYRAKHSNQEPLWTNSMFGGMPAYQISTAHHGNLISKIDAAFKLYLPHPGGYLFLYFLGFFILLLCFEVNPWLAIAGALAYGLSSYFLIIIEAGHNSKANALGYLPALIGGIVLLLKGRYWVGLSITALFSALELNANHVQITYYGYILIGVILAGAAWQAFKQKSLKEYGKAIAFFLLASLLGALPNAGNLMTTNEYGKYSTRGRTELTIDYNSIRAARSKAVSLDGSANNNESGITTPGVDPAAKERREKNTTSGLDKDYATNWSYGIGETFTFLIPDFKGGASGYIGQSDPSALKKVNPEYREMVSGSNSYYGDQPFTSGPVYIGAIIVFLAVLGMFVVQNPLKWPIFFGTLLCIALGWGSNFMPLTDFFMDHVPGYNKFRAVSMIMIIPELTLPLLAILGINELLKKKDWNELIQLKIIKKALSIKKLVFIALIVVGGFCLISYLMPDAFNRFTAMGEEDQMISSALGAGQGSEEQIRGGVAELMPQIEIARKAIFKSDAMRSLIFILLTFGVIYLYFTGKLKKELLIAALAIFITIDLWSVDMRYLNEKSFITKAQNQQLISGKTPTDDEILKDPALDYRVLNISTSTFNDASTSYYHKSIGGYHGAKLKKYQELIDFHLDEEINLFRKNAGKAFSSDSLMGVLLSRLRVINMLNTKYIIIPTGERETMPLVNNYANGNAWFIKNLKFVNDADSEIVGLYFIDPKNTAIVNNKFVSEQNIKNSYTGEGEIKMTNYEPNYLVYESNARTNQFAVFSEIYYPKGWNAYVDGQIKPHAAVNYILRGLEIPAGKHKIEFKFEPDTYKTSNSIALLGSVILFLIVLGGIYLGFKKGKSKNA
ncbi:MAG: YfhO family protein [Sphingobacteriaceae bacterium]|nr:YfhO family protein [Sphingobacteriaceae bacterium]